jgi:hypothetical protein
MQWGLMNLPAPNWGAIVSSRRMPMEKRKTSPNWEEADVIIFR